VSLALTNVNFTWPIYNKIIDNNNIKPCAIQKGIPKRSTKTHNIDIPNIALAP
jgi:hypothetical protein